MLQSSLPTLFCDTRFTVGQPDHFPGNWPAVHSLEADSWKVLLRPAYGGHPSLETLALLRFQAKDGSGSGSHTHLKKFMRLLSVHWSSFPQLKLVESVGNAPTSTCLQSRCIACLPRPQNENGRLPPCRPE